ASAADFKGGLVCLGGTGGSAPLWYGNAVFGKQPLGLILVEIHCCDPQVESAVFWYKAKCFAKARWSLSGPRFTMPAHESHALAPVAGHRMAGLSARAAP